MCVRKNLANHCTDMVTLYRVASNKSFKGLQLFCGRVPTTSHEKSPIEKNLTPPPKKKKINFEKTTIESTLGAFIAFVRLVH